MPGRPPPPEDLESLRAQLLDVDEELLALAARRQALVRGIGEAKARGGRPLFDRGRERHVHRRAAFQARRLGIDPLLAHELMAALIEASHREQERELPATRAPISRRFLLLGGAGRMGRLLARELGARGHEISVQEPGDGQDRRALMEAAEIIMVCVPMEVAAGVIREILPDVPDGALLCDINSLKAEVCAAMASAGQDAPFEALGLHPMFGPTVSAFRRQKVVVCDVRRGPLGDWLVGELGQLGVEIVETDPQTHDRMMAVVQVMVHFATLVMGEALRRSGTSIEESLRFTSPIYRLELAFTSRLFAQDPALYAAIETANPHGAEVRAHFLEAARHVAAVADGGDLEGFTETFEAVSDYFQGFTREAMRLSDFIIDTLVAQP